MADKKLIFTVTNDLSYDQRMMRICGSLSTAGYDVLLVGVRKKSSISLSNTSYRQKRLKVFFEKGFLFYAEYNLKLFFFLLFQKFDLACCIDVDTMLPVYLITRLKNKKRVYDAHEYFSQQKEIVSRKKVYNFWRYLERQMIPEFKWGYTVNTSIANIFQKDFEVNFQVIRNMPVYFPEHIHDGNERKILYRGSVNEGRGFEQLIPAMKSVNGILDIYGKGNFLSNVEALILSNEVREKVHLKGAFTPESLKVESLNYRMGITIFENKGLNQYLSLANRFFDYIQLGMPQVAMDYPEYRAINEMFEVALLIDDLSEGKIATAINELIDNYALYGRLKKNCIEAKKVLNWSSEEKKLLEFYKQIFE